VTALFLPLTWAFPDLKIVGRLDKIGWVYSPNPNAPLSLNCLSFINYILVQPLLWFELLWHSVIAYVLHALIVRKQPPDRLHRDLWKAFLICFFLAAVKISIELAATYYEQVRLARYLSGAVYYGCLFLFLTITYTYTMLTLRRPTAVLGTSTSARSMRNRLLLLCLFVTANLTIRGLHLSLEISGVGSPIGFQVLSNFLLLLRAFLDAVALTKPPRLRPVQCHCFCVKKKGGENRPAAVGMIPIHLGPSPPPPVPPTSEGPWYQRRLMSILTRISEGEESVILDVKDSPCRTEEVKLDERGGTSSNSGCNGGVEAVDHESVFDTKASQYRLDEGKPFERCGTCSSSVSGSSDSSHGGVETIVVVASE